MGKWGNWKWGTWETWGTVGKGRLKTGERGQWEKGPRGQGDSSRSRAPDETPTPGDHNGDFSFDPDRFFAELDAFLDTPEEKKLGA